MEPIILASASPKRQEYFRLLGLPFTCMPSSVDESFDGQDEPLKIAEELAKRKVSKIVESLPSLQWSDAAHPKDASWVFGADTVISLDGRIYGKPQGRENARQMLSTFQGRSHEVISALALYSCRKKTIDCRSCLSTVAFADMTPGEIEWYLNTGEWQDAAGAYKIQGLASCFVSRIEGSYSCIAGLPLKEFYDILRDNGYPYGG